MVRVGGFGFGSRRLPAARPNQFCFAKPGAIFKAYAGATAKSPVKAKQLALTLAVLPPNCRQNIAPACKSSAQK